MKPVRRLRGKKNNRSPSALARSRKRHAHFLERKLSGKQVLASSEDQQDSDDSLRVNELENTSLACGSNRDMMPSENPTPTPTADLDLLNERTILQEFLDKKNIDSDDSDNEVNSVCSNCKQPSKKGEDLKRCSHCHITRYCSVQCQRKDWDFHRFACSVVAKRADTVNNKIIYHKDLFVDLLCFCSVLCLLCLCARLFICALWSPAGKGLTSWLSFVVSAVSLSLSHWYPGSGVVLDCIDS